MSWGSCCKYAISLQHVITLASYFFFNHNHLRPPIEIKLNFAAEQDRAERLPAICASVFFSFFFFLFFIEEWHNVTFLFSPTLFEKKQKNKTWPCCFKQTFLAFPTDKIVPGGGSMITSGTSAHVAANPTLCVVLIADVIYHVRTPNIYSLQLKM